MKRRKPLRSDPEKTRDWKRRSRRNNPLSRSSGLARGPGPGRNDERRDREWIRAYGSEERVHFVRRLPCWVCGSWPSENAHTESGGMGRKADADTIVALCSDHHRELHQVGRDTFEEKHDVDLSEGARETERRWRNSNDPDPQEVEE